MPRRIWKHLSWRAANAGCSTTSCQLTTRHGALLRTLKRHEVLKITWTHSPGSDIHATCVYFFSCILPIFTKFFGFRCALFHACSVCGTKEKTVKIRRRKSADGQEWRSKENRSSGLYANFSIPELVLELDLRPDSSYANFYATVKLHSGRFDRGICKFFAARSGPSIRWKVYKFSLWFSEAGNHVNLDKWLSLGLRKRSCRSIPTTPHFISRNQT